MRRGHGVSVLTRCRAALEGAEPDVLVVGGGVHGAWAALEATLRGLDVALVERDDFGSGASANSLKILHGGFRHVATARLDRARRSAVEQATLSRFAPELVTVLPCLLQTRRRLARSRLGLWTALRLYGACRMGLDDRGIPPGRLVSADWLERHCPFLRGGDYTGGAMWHEVQLLDSERFVLAVVALAAERGALVANHVEASTFGCQGGRVAEVAVRDRVEGETVTLRPRVVYNATNLPPNRLIRGDEQEAEPADGTREPRYATGFNVVVDRQVADVAVGLEPPGSGDVSVGRDGGDRVFFLAPWLGRTLLGTGYVPGGMDAPATVDDSDVASLLERFNAAAPALDLSPEEVTHVHVGNLPAESTSGGLRLLDRPEPPGAAASDASNLVSVLTTKYTTARLAAVRGIDECERRLERSVSPTFTERISSCRLPQARPGPGPDEEITPDFVRQAVTEEMAVRLGDLLLRRTNVGAAGPPPLDVVERSARMMAEEIGWSPEERRSEIRAFLREYHPLVRPDDMMQESGNDRASDARTPGSHGGSSP